MPRDLGDLAESVDRAARSMKEGERRGVLQATIYTKKIITAEIRKATGGDMRLSGVGKSGSPPFRVADKRSKVRGAGEAREITVVGRSFHLLERDTSPHRIPRKRGKRARKRYAAFDGKVYESVNHPGTAGKYPFKKGWQRAAPRTPAIFRQEIGKQIVKVW